ncbi:MAG: hypothetical protein HY825_04690 [Acidobacteria bacterium]|nr:hypothetical protein [Acidobacteriota bacterium]
MDRKEFLSGSLAAAGALLARAAGAGTDQSDCAVRLEAADGEREFVDNWLGDLFDALDAHIDAPTRAALLAACGRACYARHAFKQEIARRGAGSLEALTAAYSDNFDAWNEGGVLHIRYGKVSKGCYCPAARHRPARPADVHCECTRATHQAVCEAALGRPCCVDILETVRRGGVTCHFAVRPA